MPAALDKIYRTNRIFSWADGHLNPNRSFVGHLLLGITPQALPIRRSYFVNFVHSVQKIPSLVALARGLGLGFGLLLCGKARWPQRAAWPNCESLLLDELLQAFDHTGILKRGYVTRDLARGDQLLEQASHDFTGTRLG